MKRVKVSAWELRSRFNASRLWELVQEGLLIEDRFYEREPDPVYNQPAGAVSVGAFIRERNLDGSPGKKVARIHYFRLHDGSINNAACKPDPKYFIDGDTTYLLDD